MSAVLILTPVVICSWPAISAAVVGAAVAMGLTVKKSVKEGAETTVREREHAEQKAAVKNSVEVELTQSEILQNVATDQEIVLTKGTIELRVKRDARGRCAICATGIGHSDAELKAVAQEFSQKMTQCFVYNRVMTELKAKGFQVVNEEQMQDETVRIHVRRWEGVTHMPKHEIEIEITRTGEVRAHIKGAKGKACLTYAKLLEQIVGGIKSQQLTSEYYEPDEKVKINLEQKH